MKEIWKDIDGYDGFYMVSNHGRIRSFVFRGKECNIIRALRKSGKKNNDYFIVSLRKNKRSKTFYVHRLVLSAFCRNPLPNEECNHIDRNRFNNHIDNLEWVTSSQNSLHSRENMSKAKCGEKHPKSKVTDRQAIEIKRLRKQKIRHKTIADKYNITVQDSMNIATRYYSHVNHLV